MPPYIVEGKKLISFEQYHKKLSGLEPFRLTGKIVSVAGLVIESKGPSASVGEFCQICLAGENVPVPAEVVGFKDDKILLMPIGEMENIGPGSEVVATGSPLRVKVGHGLKGRVLGGLGEPIDGKGPLQANEERSVYNSPPNPLKRNRISEIIRTGVRAVDGLLTCGKGQRLGIFSGSGVGKSTFLGKIARCSDADVNVIALIGERGREVREFIEKNLGEEGLKKSVVIAVTSDRPSLLRVKGAYVACTVAEYFRDEGLNVMLFLDSVTRFAFAQREVGLSIGEPPTTRGYTPSVFALLPKILERTGAAQKGSITGLYTVLVEGDDMNEPIADAVRGILDGHIVLSRALAAQNHYPPIDILESVSRSMIDIVSLEHRQAAQKLKMIYATYKEAEELINIGAYVKGSNPRIDYAISMIDRIRDYLRQDIEDVGAGLKPAPTGADDILRLVKMFELDNDIPCQKQHESSIPQTAQTSGVST
ncbi:MAG TPA: flagellar protein export ATPase FliI [Candidatus Brocadiia bacterium]|nr:flagellar protein export ATPase FliI [Candidatus Brocadiales bacterium]